MVAAIGWRMLCRHGDALAWSGATLLLLVPLNAWNVAITTDIPLMLFSAEFWKGFFHQVAYYLFIKRSGRPYNGHNPLAAMSMFFMYVLGTIFMIATYAGPSLLWAGDYEGDEAVVVDALRDLPDGAVAISDEPGQVWRAGLRTPDNLVDGSALLTDSGRVTADTLAEAAAADEVCAVVVWSDRFGQFDELPALLADEGFEVAETFGEPDENRALYLKADCAP